MKIIEIDREKLIYLIKQGKKRKSGIKIRIVENKDGCSSCIYHQVCTPLQCMCMCSRILSEVICSGNLNLPQHFTIRKE
jgi:hypothetical protein